MDDWAFLLERARSSYRAAGTPGRVRAAVSGGADSVALLLVLHALAGEEGFSLSCVHVDHGLRPESGADAAFVEALCRRLEIPCRVIRVQVEGVGEDAARRARYAALLDSFPDEPDFALALAHHRRDQAETVLLRLMRGSGGDGLAGMAACVLRDRAGGRALLWRPFLEVPPEVIRSALQSRREPWREDATNARDDYLRNYVRHQVLPAMAARCPQAEAAIARAAGLLADDGDYLRREAEKYLRDHACLDPPCRWVDAPSLRALHPALRRRAVRLASPVQLDAAQTEALAGLRPGETANLPRGWRAECGEKYLHFLPPWEETPAFSREMLSVSPFQGETGDGKRRQAVPRQTLAACTLRAWQPGDVIRPLGAGGKKSMQDYFVDKKVPRPFRGHVPLLCAGSRVIWAIGVGPGEEARVSPGSDAVLLAWNGFLPGDKPAPNER